MGEVYLAENVGPGGFVREVALKVIRPSMAEAPRFVDLFLREGRLLAGLSHRGIVQVFEMGHESGHLFMAMEYLRGVNLRELLRARGGSFPWPVAAYVAGEIARALAAAHSASSAEAPLGLIHGDLSPANVMICTDGAVKVLDFGLARPAGADLSYSGIQGKLPYLPPESLGDAPWDHRVDLYALGVVLYELVTGRLPFLGKSDLETMHLIRCGEPEPPSAVVASVPATIERIIARAISRDLGVRYSKADELASDLQDSVRGTFDADALAAFVVDAGGASTSDGPTTPARVAPARSIALGGRETAIETAIETSSPPSRPAGRRRGATIAAVVLLVAGLALGALALERAQRSPDVATPREDQPPRAVESTAKVPATAARREGTIVVSVDSNVADVAVDGKMIARAADGARVTVEADVAHEVAATLPDGTAQRRTITVGEGATVSVELELARPAAAQAAATPKAIATKRGARRDRRSRSPRRRSPPTGSKPAQAKDDRFAPVDPFEPL